jgi:hypothetical protein
MLVRMILAAIVLGLGVGCGSDDGGEESNTGGFSATGGTSQGGLGGASTASDGSGGAVSIEAMLPVPLGTFPGANAKTCNGATCAAGQACCITALTYECTTSFDDCPCSGGSCLLRGCSAPSDCLGQKCCAIVNPYSPPLGFLAFVATSCKAQCDAVSETAVCATSADCAAGESCSEGARLSTCF